MEWWSKECYICFKEFNSKDVPRLLPYSCKHDICEHCFMKLYKYDNFRDQCSICKACQSFDSTNRRRAYSIGDEPSLLVKDIYQQILLHREFPSKMGEFIPPSKRSILQKIKTYWGWT